MPGPFAIGTQPVPPGYTQNQTQPADQIKADLDQIAHNIAPPNFCLDVIVNLAPGAAQNIDLSLYAADGYNVITNALNTGSVNLYFGSANAASPPPIPNLVLAGGNPPLPVNFARRYERLISIVNLSSATVNATGYLYIQRY